jgi:transcriptional regulator with XRE-family HTH domain
MWVFRTLLEQKIKERRQTFEEFAEFAEVFARKHGESGTISVRHLQRLVAGHGPGGQPLGSVRPANARLLERIFGVNVEELLSPPVEATPHKAETAYRRRAGLAAARKAAGHTQESLAAELHIATSTIVRWEAGDFAPLPYLRPKLARLLGCSQQQLDDLIREPESAPANQQLDEESGAVHAELVGDLGGWLSDSTRQRVAARLETWDLGSVRDRGSKLRNVGRSQLAHALADYYGDVAAPHRVYVVDVDGRRVSTSVLTRPEWSELALPLRPDTDRVVLADVEPDSAGRTVHVDDHQAVDRLAEAAVLGVRITNKPLTLTCKFASTPRHRLLKFRCG